MLSRRVVAVVAVVVVIVVLAGLAWRLSTGRVTVGPLTVGHQGPVTVGVCRVPAGPLAVVVASSVGGSAWAPGGVVSKIMDYEIAHAKTARSLTVVQVDGDTNRGVGTMNLAIGGRFVTHDVRQMFAAMQDGGAPPAPATETGALSGLRAAATEVRKTGSPATVVLWDPAGTLDLRAEKTEKPPDLRGLTVIVAGEEDAARRWSAVAHATGAACVGLTGD